MAIAAAARGSRNRFIARIIVGCEEKDRALLGAIRIPVPNPVREPNRYNLEPLKPETPKTTLYLVLPQVRLTLQVVCFGLAHFQLPVRPPKCPSPPTGENPGRPWGRWAGDPPLRWCGCIHRAET